MSFSSWTEFFHMGGYALYVWLSYGITLAVLGMVILALLLRHRQLKRDLEQRTRRQRRS
ncbi:MAG: heme exporter protein CcmD [Candidatus Competibacteraceae bacterium]